MSVITTVTRTGKIFCDHEKHLEWLYVGDYGKENNIKANFLGLTKKIDGVEHKPVNLVDKMVVTISTQKGCEMLCDFCDAPRYGYHGNCSTAEMLYMINHALIDSNVDRVNRLNVHFARVGEPTFNYDVIETAEEILPLLHGQFADVVHPVLSTMFPKNNPQIIPYLLQWCALKNLLYKGEAGLQISINTTDEEKRNIQFNGASLSLREISEMCDTYLPTPIGRKYTLNFAITQDTVLDAKRLDQLFDKNKFIVKITPIHKTVNAIKHGYNVTTSYEKYDVYEAFEEPLLELGWDVIVFVPSKEEDDDRITCGNALLSDKRRVDK